MARSVRPEIRALAGCTRLRMSPETVAQVRECARQGLDWGFLINEANRHSVLPLLHRNLRRHFWQEVPEAFRDNLTDACQRFARHNLALTAELLRILALFEKAGIAAVPFKGPILAALAYGDLSLRSFGDLDILLREEDLTRACEIIVADGYAARHELSREEERAYRRNECALEYWRPGREDRNLELHWRLTERNLAIQLPIAAFWERLTRIELAGKTIPGLAPEDLLLYLCVHGTKHEWERLEWICCIGELAAALPDIDWRGVVERAREIGISRMLNLGLLLAAEVNGLVIPEAIRQGVLEDAAARMLARELTGKLLSGETRPGPKTEGRADWYLFMLRTRERWTDRVRIVVLSWVRLPHPDSEELVNLPPRFAPLYYLFRPVRLLGASIAATWRYYWAQRKAVRPLEGQETRPPAAGPALTSRSSR